MTGPALPLDLPFEPREWQALAFDAWRDSGRRGVVAVVTGGGKTRLAEMCIADFLQREPSGRVIVIVPTLALVDQWAVGLQDDLDLSEEAIGVFAEGKSPGADVRLSILTLVSARENAPRLAGDGQSLLIVDECHRIGSPVNALALDGDFTETLGLSATPEREFDDAFDEVIAPALGDVFFRYGYDEARRDGVISPFDLVNVRVPLLPHEEERYSEMTKRVSRLYGRFEQGEDVEDRLGRLLQERARVAAGALMRIPVSVKIVDQHRGQRALVFHEHIHAAEQIREQLQAREHSVAIYHSRLGPALRYENLRMYRRGMFDTLVTCRALDEGVNVPETQVAVIASATSSHRQRVQRLGRVLRPAPGKDRATVYTLYATDSEDKRLRQEEADGVSGADSITWMKTGAPA